MRTGTMKWGGLFLAAISSACIVSVAEAQSLSNLYSFSTMVGSDATNGDGASPFAGVVLSGGTLYGTAYEGGTSGAGTVFAIKTNGLGFTNLHSFTNGSDGENPDAVLVLSGNFLYGTADSGGNSGEGGAFAINTNGTPLTNLYNFTATSGPLATNSDGASPQAGLLLFDNTFYGTASDGGIAGSGTIFGVTSNGFFTNFYNFTNGTDGAYPLASLTQSGSFYYGTTLLGGSNGYGTVFAVNTNGSFSALWGFTNGADGAYPWASLIVAGSTLFGTTSGINLVPVVSPGTVFKINIDGTGFTPLHEFSAVSGPALNNGDGANPVAALLLSGNMLYGTAENGGLGGFGAIFCVNTNGLNFTNLYNFTGGGDGANPAGQLILVGNLLYGTTSAGGPGGSGTIFALNLAGTPPGRTQLNVRSGGAAAILIWTGSPTAYFLQSATSVNGPFSTVPSATSPYTNSFSQAQQFFRLVSNY